MLRRQGLWWGGCLLAAVAGVVWLTGSPASAQKTKGKTRAAETKFLMRGVMFPNCAAVAKALKGEPADDKAWEQLALNASLLNEMGYLLMDDGRCPDKVWAGATKKLRECSAKLLEAVNDKKVDDAKAAFKALTGACAECHGAHKK